MDSSNIADITAIIQKIADFLTLLIEFLTPFFPWDVYIPE